jgi:hypothetical protein
MIQPAFEIAVFRPIPVLARQQVAMIRRAVHLALKKDLLPEARFFYVDVVIVHCDPPLNGKVSRRQTVRQGVIWLSLIAAEMTLPVHGLRWAS